MALYGLASAIASGAMFFRSKDNGVIARWSLSVFQYFLPQNQPNPSGPYQKSFRTATRLPKHNVDFSFL
jgi:hypothetical protein